MARLPFESVDEVLQVRISVTDWPDVKPLVEEESVKEPAPLAPLLLYTETTDPFRMTMVRESGEDGWALYVRYDVSCCFAQFRRLLICLMKV